MDEARSLVRLLNIETPYDLIAELHRYVSIQSVGQLLTYMYDTSGRCRVCKVETSYAATRTYHAVVCGKLRLAQLIASETVNL